MREKRVQQVNLARADRARNCLLTYRNVSFIDGDELGDAVTDLLADLQHWCSLNDVEFEDNLSRAFSHFQDERREG